MIGMNGIWNIDSALALNQFPSVEDRVALSTNQWADDLKGIYNNARDRFSDVAWETDTGERIFAHKAVVYVRAPKAFKDRYFLFLQNQSRAGWSQSSLAINARSPSPFPTTPPFANGTSVRNTPSPSYLAAARSSSLSVDTIESDGTLRAPTLNTGGDGILKLGQDDPPEMFRAQLEWLYTGEGFGDVVEWISGDNAAGPGAGNLRDSLGRRGNVSERRDKLGNDLTYMWTSKLYCDVRIHITAPESDGYGSDTSGDSDDSLAETVIFTAHRFMLVSRSPYFASVFLNPSSFRPATADIQLDNPPFTPAALHFCLGWIYAGHLDFSNRSFDLSTAFQIHLAAAFLQLDSLVAEVESRLVYDFCDNMDWDKCHCRRCLSRVPRVWRFTCRPEVNAPDLHRRARRFMIAGWRETWGREVGSADRQDREELTKDFSKTMTPGSVIAVFRGISRIRHRMSQAIRSKGPDAAGWTDALGEMVEQIEKRARDIIATHFVAVCESKELWDALNGVGMNEDALDMVLAETVEIAGRPTTSVEAPRMYQTIVSSLLLKVNPETLQPMLRTGSQARHKVEQAKEGVLSHIRRRWMGIKDAAGFVGLEPWSLKEISDELDLPMDDLLGVTFPRSSAGFPRTASTAAGLADSNSSAGSRAASRADRQSRSSVDQASEISSNSQTSHPSQGQGHANRASVSTLRGVETPEPSERNGLRRLRLSSSASSASVTSSRAASRAAAASQSSRQTPTSSGPTPRSPTAASKTLVVSVGSRHRVSPSLGSPNSPTPTVMSGPPRPLLTGKRPVSKLKGDGEKNGEAARAGPSTLRHQSSLSSVRSTPSAKTPTAARTPTTRASVSSRPSTTSTSSAKSTARPTPGSRSPTKPVSSSNRSPTKATATGRPGISSTRPGTRLRTVSTPNAASTGRTTTTTPGTRAPITHSRTSSVASASTASSAARAAAANPKTTHSRTSSVSSTSSPMVRPGTSIRATRASSTASTTVRPATAAGRTSFGSTHSRNPSVTSTASGSRTPLSSGARPPTRLTRDSSHSRNGSLASLRSVKSGLSGLSAETPAVTAKPTPRSGMTKSASMMSVRSTRATKPAETPKPTPRASTGSTDPSQLKTFRTRSVSMANLKTTSTPTPRSSLAPTTPKTPTATATPKSEPVRTARPRPSTSTSTRIRTTSTTSPAGTATRPGVRPRTSSLASTRSHATIAEDPDTPPPLPNDAKERATTTTTRTRTISMTSAASRASTTASIAEEATPAASKPTVKSTRPRASLTSATPTSAGAGRGKAASPSAKLSPRTPTTEGTGKMLGDQLTPKAAGRPSAPSRAGTLRPSTSSRNISRSVSEATLKSSNSAKSLSSKTGRESGAVTPKASAKSSSLEPSTPTAAKQRSVSAKVTSTTPSANGTPRRSTSGLSPATAGTPRQRAVSAGSSLWKRATPLPPKVAGIAGQDNSSPKSSRSPRASNSPSTSTASTVSSLKSASRGRLRSSSGSTEGPSEAITPRMSASVEPIIAQEQEDAPCAPPLQSTPSPEAKTDRPPSVLLHRPEVEAMRMSAAQVEEEDEAEAEAESPTSTTSTASTSVEAPANVTVTLNDESEEVDVRVTPRATRAERARATSESTTPTSSHYPPHTFGVPHRSASSPVSAISGDIVIPPRKASITVSITDDESESQFSEPRSSSAAVLQQPFSMPGTDMLSDEPQATNLPPPSSYSNRNAHPTSAPVPVPPTPTAPALSLPNTPPVRPSSLAASPMSAASLHSVLTTHGSPASQPSSVRSHSSPYRPHPAHAFDPPPREKPAPVAAPITPPKIEVTDENEPFRGRGVSLHVGIPCIVALTSRRARFRANAKYLGSLSDKPGNWVGIEVEDLDRFGIETLPTGARAGVRYFHFTVPSTPAPEPEQRQAREMRLRRIGSIADSLPRRRLGLGLSNARSGSPFDRSGYGGEWVAPEKPRALFVRPEEVLFVMGADP